MNESVIAYIRKEIAEWEEFAKTEFCRDAVDRADALARAGALRNLLTAFGINA